MTILQQLKLSRDLLIQMGQQDTELFARVQKSILHLITNLVEEIEQ